MASASAASVPAAAHSARDLERISAQPGNRVLTWAEPGERRRDAFTAEQLEVLVPRLQARVVDTVRARPGTNELMLRMELGTQPVGDPAPSAAYTWADFAAHYPTFWSKITSASSTRRDMVTIRAMLAARRAFEQGTSTAADERELEGIIQSDILALNMDSHSSSSASGGAEGGEGSGRGGGNSNHNSPQVRRALEQARLRRRVLERQFADVRAPSEELAALGVDFSPSRSCIHEIVREHAERGGKKGGGSGSARGHKRGAAAEGRSAPLPPPVVRFARRLLELRVNIAKERGAMPDELEPKGATFMPTFVRSAQLELEWQDAWSGAPLEMPGEGEEEEEEEEEEAGAAA
jgi:hypothetical protein